MIAVTEKQRDARKKRKKAEAAALTKAKAARQRQAATEKANERAARTVADSAYRYGRFALGGGVLLAGLLWWSTRGVECHPDIGCFYWPFAAAGIVGLLVVTALHPRLHPDEDDEDVEPVAAPVKKSTPRKKTKAVAKTDVALVDDGSGNLLRSNTTDRDTTDEMEIPR